MKVSVIVPTWNRVALLTQCLKSIERQSVKPDEVIVVFRDIDLDTEKFLAAHVTTLKLIYKKISVSGVIHAENLGIRSSTGDILFFIDDDGEAPVNWISTIVDHFKTDANILGVGGPDYIVNEPDKNYRKVVKEVGKISWYGKVVGNHHHTPCSKMEVDVLKGVNMAFRREVVVPLDSNLDSEHSYGNGAYWELDLCMQIKNNHPYGIFLFEPSIDVNHHSGHAHVVQRANTINSSRNLTYVMLKNLKPLRMVIFTLYTFLIGNEVNVGLLKIIFEFVRLEKISIKKYIYSIKGQYLGWLLYIKTFCRK